MRRVAILGAGPAGLIAAEILSAAGVAVALFDRMDKPGRKFLLAGRGGLNLTHGEALEPFLARYGAARGRLEPAIRAFDPAALRAWCEGLGQPTFVGSSGRVFPRAMKASPLLRAWLARLGKQGVRFHGRRRWLGWDEAGALRFRDADGGETAMRADAVILALGGASWPKFGSDGAWVEILRGQGIRVNALKPANAGFRIAWSKHLVERFAGAPLKTVAFSFGGARLRGEAVVTRDGIEGGAIYALSAALREAIAAEGRADLLVDLRPDATAEALASRLARPRGKASLGNFLRRAAGLSPLAVALLREPEGAAPPADPAALAARLKALPLTVIGIAPIERAISSAGGIDWSELDEGFMLRRLPGTFAAGEMLDWEAPTGGYLLQACFATGAAAAQGCLDWLATRA